MLVVHGGAGTVPRERSEQSVSGVRSAARAGYAILRGGGSSMDAVVEAVAHMEDNPSYNAGDVNVCAEKFMSLCVVCLELNC